MTLISELYALPLTSAQLALARPLSALMLVYSEAIDPADLVLLRASAVEERPRDDPRDPS